MESIAHEYGRENNVGEVHACSNIIYILIAIKVPKWFIKAIAKIRRAFLWKGRKQVNGGSCLVSWEKVQRPLEFGGLGILNLNYMSWALQIRWLWLKKIEEDKLGSS